MERIPDQRSETPVAPHVFAEVLLRCKPDASALFQSESFAVAAAALLQQRVSCGKAVVAKEVGFDQDSIGSGQVDVATHVGSDFVQLLQVRARSTDGVLVYPPFIKESPVGYGIDAGGTASVPGPSHNGPDPGEVSMGLHQEEFAYPVSLAQRLVWQPRRKDFGGGHVKHVPSWTGEF
jgi:hypothetical protein